MRLPAAALHYIGGLTPLVPTVTRLAVSLPSAFFVAPNITPAPGLRSARAAGAKVTIGGVRRHKDLLGAILDRSASGRAPSSLPPPPVTLALVIMLPGCRSQP